MTKLGNKIRNVLGDITVEDLIVCPIDDHMTIGVQGIKIILPSIEIKNVKSRPIVLTNNNMMIDPTYLIF